MAFQPFLPSRKPNGMNSRILRTISHQYPIQASQNSPLTILVALGSLVKRVIHRMKKIYRAISTFRFFSPNGAPFSALLYIFLHYFLVVLNNILHIFIAQKRVKRKCDEVGVVV